MDGGEVRLALAAPVDACTREVTAVAHAHVACSVVGKCGSGESASGLLRGTERRLEAIAAVSEITRGLQNVLESR